SSIAADVHTSTVSDVDASGSAASVMVRNAAATTGSAAATQRLYNATGARLNQPTAISALIRCAGPSQASATTAAGSAAANSNGNFGPDSRAVARNRVSRGRVVAAACRWPSEIVLMGVPFSVRAFGAFGFQRSATAARNAAATSASLA